MQLYIPGHLYRLKECSASFNPIWVFFSPGRLSYILFSSLSFIALLQNVVFQPINQKVIMMEDLQSSLLSRSVLLGERNFALVTS